MIVEYRQANQERLLDMNLPDQQFIYMPYFLDSCTSKNRRCESCSDQLRQMCASIAMLLAVSSVNSTCFFMLYQPDVPEELL